MVSPILKFLFPLIHHFSVGPAEYGGCTGQGDAASFDFDTQTKPQGMKGLELIVLWVFGHKRVPFLPGFIVGAIVRALGQGGQGCKQDERYDDLWRAE